MSDTEFYVVDMSARPPEIVNCITTSGNTTPDLPPWYDPERYKLRTNPPKEWLERYEFWDKRP